MKQVKPTLRVLMTGAGAPGAAGIIRCLRENGERPVYIVGVDMNPNAGGRALVDAFYCIPSAKDPSFLSVVTDICLKERVEVILPIVTKELFTFASHKAELAALGIRVSVMDADRLYIANDKGRLLSAVRAAGLPTPRFCLVNTYDELISAIWAMGYPEVPVCVKATDGNGSRGVRIVDRPHPDPDRFFNEKPNSAFISLDYLEKTLQGQSLPTLMVMEYLPGDEYSVDVLADQNGVRDIVCRRGLRVVSSIQTECVVERSPALEQACRDITHALGLQGVFGFDLKCRADGSPALMEINPRLTAGIVACAAAGCNLPYRALLLALGEPLPDTHIRYGTLMTRRYQEEFFTADGTPIPSLEEVL